MILHCCCQHLPKHFADPESTLLSASKTSALPFVCWCWSVCVLLFCCSLVYLFADVSIVEFMYLGFIACQVELSYETRVSVVVFNVWRQFFDRNYFPLFVLSLSVCLCVCCSLFVGWLLGWLVGWFVCLFVRSFASVFVCFYFCLLLFPFVWVVHFCSTIYCLAGKPDGLII